MIGILHKCTHTYQDVNNPTQDEVAKINVHSYAQAFDRVQTEAARADVVNRYAKNEAQEAIDDSPVQLSCWINGLQPYHAARQHPPAVRPKRWLGVRARVGNR